MFENENLLKCAIDDNSILSLSQKLELIHWRIYETKGNSFETEGLLNWIMEKWALWFEKNSDKKNQLYIYKKRTRDLNKPDDEPIDEDKIEVRFLVILCKNKFID